MKLFRNHLFETSRIPFTALKKALFPLALGRREHICQLNSFLRLITPALLIVLALRAGTAMAQDPVMIIDDASVFEGDGDTKILKLPVSFLGPQTTTVSGVVSAIPLPGSGFNSATGGTACAGSGADFEQFSNVPFSIPPNTPNGTLSVNIVVCGDTVIEPNEQIFVFFSSNVSGADCSLEGTCNAIGTIRNNDGPPSISINNVSSSEPVLRGSQANTAFTVSLSHPSLIDTTVNFATRDGTAKATGILPDYISRTGSLTIPANTLTSTINVPILGDQILENSQTFFVNLTNPVNSTIADGIGQGTIRDTTLTIGGFDLSPDDAHVQADEIVDYSVVWSVPENEVWRDLKAIDLRVGKDDKTALWVHWDEADNTFSVCEKVDDDAGDGPDEGEICTAGVLPGSPEVLETPFGRLHLAKSSVVGSGPTGRSVTLNLAISLGPKAGGQYHVELAASDDFGRQDGFVRASELHIVGGK